MEHSPERERANRYAAVRQYSLAQILVVMLATQQRGAARRGPSTRFAGSAGYVAALACSIAPICWRSVMRSK
jgi:hypothetical protein